MLAKSLMKVTVLLKFEGETASYYNNHITLKKIDVFLIAHKIKTILAGGCIIYECILNNVISNNYKKKVLPEFTEWHSDLLNN